MKIGIDLLARKSVLTSDESYRRFGEELELGIACSESLLGRSDQVGDWLAQCDAPDLERGDAIRAAGGSLRALHGFLKDKDSTFFGLVRVQNMSGKFLLIHEQFIDDY